MIDLNRFDENNIVKTIQIDSDVSVIRIAAVEVLHIVTPEMSIDASL